MQKQSWLKSALPNFIAIVSFIVISAIFCAPALKGDRVAPHDTVSWIYMSQEARDYYEKNGTTPGWTNSMFSGMPAIAIYEPTGSSWYSILAQKIQMQPSDWLVNPIGILLLCMIGAFVLLKSLKVNPLIAAFGAISYGLTSYIPIIIGAGHITKVLDLAYLPGVLGGLILIYRGKWVEGIITYLLFLCFYYSAFHLQIIYYSLFLIAAMVIFFLVNAIKEKQILSFVKASAMVLVCTVVALISVYSVLKGTSQYAQYSMRGGGSELTITKTDKLQETNGGLAKDYAFNWSNGIGEVFCAIIPNLYGGASGSNIGEESNFGQALSELGAAPNQVAQYTSRAPTYFGPQSSLAGPVYFGAIVCFLSILALFVVKNGFKWVLFGAGVFFAMISWGKNFEVFNYWMFDHFPLFNKFRSPNMALSITAITTIALAFWGLVDVVKGLEKNRADIFKKFKNAAITTLGLVVVLIIYSQMFMSHKGNSDAQLSQSLGDNANKVLSALREDRASMALKDGLRSLAFILVAAAAIWALIKERISSQVAIIIIGVASIIDLWSVGKRYLNDDMYLDEYTIEQQYFTPTQAIAQIQQDKDPHFRVMDLSIDYTNDAKTSYFLKTIGGYHPAKIQTYQDLIATQISKLNHSVLNMLNTKYIITPGQSGGGPMVIPNTEALGNAWFVSDLKYTSTADATIQAMDAPAINDPKRDSVQTGFNAAKEAIVREQYKAEIGASNFVKDSAAKIVLTNYDLPHMQYESNNSHDGFAVFSEVYLPENWKAFVDGKETEIYPVNYLLRGIKVPAGKHKIEFKYHSDAFAKGANIELMGSILVTLVLVGVIAFYFMKKRKPEDDGLVTKDIF